MGKISEQQIPPKYTGLSNETIAHAVLKEVGKGKQGTLIALEVFLKSAKWCNPNRRSSILREIGRIGGMASANRTKLRLKKERQEAEKRRQGKFVFT